MLCRFSHFLKAAAVLSLVFCFSGALYSQPKSVGIRTGYDIRAVYQHHINGSYFVEFGAGTSVSGGFILVSFLTATSTPSEIQPPDSMYIGPPGLALGIWLTCLM